VRSKAISYTASLTHWIS